MGVQFTPAQNSLAQMSQFRAKALRERGVLTSGDPRVEILRSNMWQAYNRGQSSPYQIPKTHAHQEPKTTHAPCCR